MSHSIQEDELMIRFRQNDKQAFEQVFRLFDKALYYYTFSRIHDRQLAEDIVSECFMKLWIRHTHFDALPALKAFLYATAGNAVADHWRNVRRKVELMGELPPVISSDDPEGDERMKIEAEVLRELNAEIDNIPGKAGEVFRLYYFQKLTTGEIAEQMGVSGQTVLNHKSYAIRLLRTSLFRKGILFSVIANGLLLKAGLPIF
jgi:RNA polymerase sigma factor (sigma-70 family)